MKQRFMVLFASVFIATSLAMHNTDPHKGPIDSLEWAPFEWSVVAYQDAHGNTQYALVTREITFVENQKTSEREPRIASVCLHRFDGKERHSISIPFTTCPKKWGVRPLTKTEKTMLQTRAHEGSRPSITGKIQALALLK